MIQNYKRISALFLVICIYTLLTMHCVNNGYFWDNIQLISKEAHRFFQFGFKTVIIPSSSEAYVISSTGYHPPLIGMITALLWKIFGYSLWVSHLFTFFCALILIFNLWKLIRLFFPEQFQGWVLLIVMLESSLLTQFSIASPDFILFTAFIVSLRGIVQNNRWLTVFGVSFLCFISMRGVFTGVILFLVSSYFSIFRYNMKSKFQAVIHNFIPFLPAFILLTIYYSNYLYSYGWFFSSNSPYSEHYSLPNNLNRIALHLAEFVLRSVENGRIIIWLLGIYFLFIIVKLKHKPDLQVMFLFWLFLSLNALYLLFVFISQMPFSARYFLPQFFILTILTLWGIIKYAGEKRIKWIFILILLFELTGNFWIYPEIISKSWDNTLAHLPYYQLRKDCFNYIDQQKMNYDHISAGFCLYGNRKFVELENEDKTVGVNTNNKYFIYSNISNLDDSVYYDLKNTSKWKPVKKFEKGFVNMILYKNLKFNQHEN